MNHGASEYVFTACNTFHLSSAELADISEDSTWLGQSGWPGPVSPLHSVDGSLTCTHTQSKWRTRGQSINVRQ